MITLTITPGPSKPKDLMSFLKPIIEEISALSTNGFKVLKNSEEVYSSKVYLLGMTGDIPGVAELINHAGHTSKHGCRICDTLAVILRTTPYFPNDGVLRSLQSLIDGDSVR